MFRMSVRKCVTLFSASSAMVLMGLGIGVAEVKVKSTVSYYQVQGANGKELQENMISEGGKRIPLNHAIAATQYDFDYLEPKIGVKNGKPWM